MVVFVVERIDRYSHFCEYLVLLLYQAGSAQLDFYLIKDRCHFSIFDNPIGRESSDFGPKSDDLGHRILKSDYYLVGFCKIGLQKQAHLFFR